MTISKLGIILLTLIAFSLSDMAVAKTEGADSQKEITALPEATRPKPSTRTITDMGGRKVQVPTTINKVLSTAPPPTTFVYMLAPEKLGGWLGGATRATTGSRPIPPDRPTRS